MKKYLSLIILILCIGNLKSQQASDSEFGFIEAMKATLANDNMNLHTGNVSVDLPLYTYKDKDFEIPVSLQYSSSGYKTYTAIGSVGLGWILNAGGYITRKVNGMPDESSRDCTVNTATGTLRSSTFYGHYKYRTAGAYSEWQNNGEVFIDLTPLYHYGCNAKYSGSYIETTPDLFTFNFLGHKGNFMINWGNTYVFDTSQPEGEYNIEMLEFTTDKVHIRITTGDGYKYTFLNNEAKTSNLMSFYYIKPLQTSPSTYYPLTEIEAPNGRKVIFKYNTLESNSTAHTYFAAEGTFTSDSYNHPTRLDCGFLAKGEGTFPLKKIIIEDTDIDFDYVDRSKDTIALYSVRPGATSSGQYTTLDVVKNLKSISVKNKYLSEPFKEFTFQYNYSKSRGYLYSRIIPFLKSVQISGEGVYNMHYYGEDDYFPTLLQARDYWGYWNKALRETGNDFPDRMYYEANNTEIETGNEYLPDYKGALQGMLKTLVYPTGGYTNYYYESHDYGYKLMKDLRNNMKNNSYLEYQGFARCGGLRVKRITNYTNSEDSTYIHYYYYVHNPEDEEYISTGILLHHPRFFRLGPGVKQVSWSNDFTAPEDGTHIAYSQVMKKYPDGSYCTYNFSDYHMFPDLPHDKTRTFRKIYMQSYDESKYIDNFFAKNDSRHRLRGKLLSKNYYTPQHRLTYSEQYKYNFDKVNRNLSGEEKSKSPYPLPSEYDICVAGEAFSYFYIQNILTRSVRLDTLIKATYASHASSSPFVEKTCFSYNSIGQLSKKELILENGKNISNLIIYPYDLKSENRLYDYMFDRGIRNTPIQTFTSVSGQGVVEASFNYYTNIRTEERPLYRVSETKKTELKSPLNLNESSPEWYNYFKSQQIIKYTAEGNVQEITDRDGTSATYIWSYNRKYPVVEIKNITYNDIKKHLSSSQAAFYNTFMNLSFPEESTIRFLGDMLRQALPNSLVTTYTYQPLIGITSETDYSGVTIYYLYDSTGHLKESYIIENEEKKILETYDFKFVTQ